MNRENNDLVNLLRTQLSEAINLQNKDTIAQLHEALRCVRQFDSDGYVRLGFNAIYTMYWEVFQVLNNLKEFLSKLISN